jgi:hypothetical protein
MGLVLVLEPGEGMALVQSMVYAGPWLLAGDLGPVVVLMGGGRLGRDGGFGDVGSICP